MQKPVAGVVGKSKSTPICSYIFHLYYSINTLSGEEILAYQVGQEMIKYDFNPKLKSKLVVSEDSKQQILV